MNKDNFKPENEKCQTCQDLEDAVSDVNIHRMLFDVLANKERERYLKLSRWGKFKYKLHRFKRWLQHKQNAPLILNHPACRCYIKKVEDV